jgi:hypothetical protein
MRRFEAFNFGVGESVMRGLKAASICVCRDERGDKSYTIWTAPPVLSHGEWVPDWETQGRIPSAQVTESFAVALAGRKLALGDMEIVLLNSPGSVPEGLGPPGRKKPSRSAMASR